MRHVVKPMHAVKGYRPCGRIVALLRARYMGHPTTGCAPLRALACGYAWSRTSCDVASRRRIALRARLAKRNWLLEKHGSCHNMDLRFEHQAVEAKVKRKWWYVFHILFAPAYVFFGSMIVLLGGMGMSYDKPVSYLCYSFALGLFILSACIFSINWRAYRELFRKMGSFERPTVVHLTDTYLESACGENIGKHEYRIFSYYLPLKKHIALVVQKSITAVFDRSDFPDGGGEWIRCLEANGVKKFPIWGLKRWWFALLYLVFAIMFIAGMLRTIKRNNEEWCRDKGYYTRCISNLKMVGMCLQLYAAEHVDKANPNVKLLPPSLQNLTPKYHDEAKFFHCPVTEEEYRYVPYGRMPDAKTAAKTPILIDVINSIVELFKILMSLNRRAVSKDVDLAEAVS